MTTHPQNLIAQLVVARARAACCTFPPKGTVRCTGRPMFRSEMARDLGCLLDVDPEVLSWSCLPLALAKGDSVHVPDFHVERTNGSWLQDACDSPPTAEPSWIALAALSEGLNYMSSDARDIRSGFRLLNSRELLRYAGSKCPLGDRLRLLAALDEQTSMAVRDCLSGFRETQPIAGLASLILHRFVEVDLDEGRIGPETIVRRRRV